MEFKINILPFTILKQQVDVYFSKEEKVGFCRIYKYDLPKNTPMEFKQQIETNAWWSLIQDTTTVTVSVNLIENKRFAKHYFNNLIFNHFTNQNIITNRNFIKDTEILLEDSSFHNADYKRYSRFSLRIDTNELIEGTSLLISYDGDSYILNKSLGATQLLSDYIGKIKYQDKITKFKLLSDTEKNDTNNIYPVLNRDIRKALSIDTGRNFSENKYKKYYEQIYNFYNNYLKDIVISDCIKIFESGFYKPYDTAIRTTSEESNLLLFGNNQKNFIPYIGLKEYGPLLPPPSSRPVKFMFIFHENDKQLANKIYSYLKKGYKSFPGLESFVKIQFDIDTNNSIQYTSTSNPLSEIREKLQSISIDTEANNYVALYISYIRKDTLNEEEDSVYFNLKELLLKNRITSQVVYRENIDNPSFNYFLPNIAIALLAKLGGIPWRLYRPIKNDLIIGVGADRSSFSNNNFIGNAFCFKNDGSFKGFNAFEKSDTSALAESIKGSIQEYIAENSGCERMVIHYYKNMGYEEEEPIRRIIENLNLSLPYVVITINSTESKDYVLFDNSFDGKMPQSGTYIKTKWNEFILCNNTRYSINTATRLDGFPLPIKIKMKSSNYEKINNDEVVKELIDQVYQFSRMYWKSVRQRNMPVTIEYSEIVAKMISHFSNKSLEPFARNSLWFL